MCVVLPVVNLRRPTVKRPPGPQDARLTLWPHHHESSSVKYALLLLTAFFVAQLGLAQVGVNESNPTQTLDVNGKIKVGDDATAPERGTIRFNDATDEFEGYDGTEWKVLSTEAKSGTPSDPVPYGAHAVSINPGGLNADVRFFPADGFGSFTEVPAGKYFIVTFLQAVDSNTPTTEQRIHLVIRSGPFNNVRNSQGLQLFGTNFAPPTVVGDLSNPITILRPGDRLLRTNLSSSQTSTRLYARGFLVDELDF